MKNITEIINNNLFETAIEYMDDEIREDLAFEIGDTATEAEFLAEYCKRHEQKFGEEFEI